MPTRKGRKPVLVMFTEEERELLREIEKSEMIPASNFLRKLFLEYVKKRKKEKNV